MTDRRISVFFYGSYMNRDVLKEANLHPEHLQVACLRGWEIRIQPLANLNLSEEDSVYGIVTQASHAELQRLYAHARDVLGGTYLPEAVLVQALQGAFIPALCYVAPEMQTAPAASDYIDRIVGPARSYGFPESYIAKLESFRT